MNDKQIQQLSLKLSSSADPKALATDLVRAGKLTAFQAKFLLQGRGKELILGPYVLLDMLGEGGMGQVFKAKQQKLDRMVALKVIHKDRTQNKNALRRFQREIQATSKLEHPNIVRGFNADEIDGQLIFEMEFVEGVDLSKLVKSKGPLPEITACDYIRQAALGLQHAHEKGIIHRDIKPQNLLLSNNGGVKILDMGLARRAESDDGSVTLTQEGTVVGTADYLAPEQAVSAHNVDVRADIYSLGATLYFLLAGRVPFPGGTLTEKLIKCQLEEPERIEKLRPDLSPQVARIIRKMMAKKPDARFQTAADVAAALSSDEETVAIVVKKSNRAKIYAMVAVALTILFAGVFFVIPKSDSKPSLKETKPITPQYAYLIDLPETVINLQQTGAVFGQVVFGPNNPRQKSYPKSLGVAPPGGSFIGIRYNLDQKYSIFKSSVCNMDSMRRGRAPLIFKVLGDGKLIWQSKPHNDIDFIEPVEVSVANVNILDLQLHITDSQEHAAAAWLDPQVIKK